MKYKCFGLSLDFLNIMLENRLRFLSIFFLTFVSLLSWTVYLVRFNTDDKHQHNLHNAVFSSFDLSLFTKKDGITINEDRKVFLIRNFITFKEF